MKKRTTLYIEDSIYDILKTYAFHKDVSISFVVTKALMEFLKVTPETKGKVEGVKAKMVSTYVRKTIKDMATPGGFERITQRLEKTDASHLSKSYQARKRT